MRCEGVHQWRNPKIIVATDGSEAAITPPRRSMDLLRPHAQVVVVVVVPEYEDPMDNAGGVEGPGISPEGADKDWKRSTATGRSALDRTAAVLGPDVEVRLSPTTINGGRCRPSCPRDRCRRTLIGSSGRNWFTDTSAAPSATTSRVVAVSRHADPPRSLSAEPPQPVPEPHGQQRSHTLGRPGIGSL